MYKNNNTQFARNHDEESLAEVEDVEKQRTPGKENRNMQELKI